MPLRATEPLAQGGSQRRPTVVDTLLRLARNGFRRGLQYRGAHMLNNLASAVFGVVFVAVWRSALSGHTGKAIGATLHLTATWATHYVAVTQGLLWITVFLPAGLGIPEAVRTGQVVADLTRPTGFWVLHMAREAGGAAYNLLYRTLPVLAGLAFLVGVPRPATVGAALVALTLTGLAVWNALCLHYLVGISSFWTTEARAAHNLLIVLMMSLGCGEVPLRVFPDALRVVLPWLPFSSLLSTPALAWMGSVTAPGAGAAAAWAVILAAMCGTATNAAQRRLAVQGG